MVNRSTASMTERREDPENRTDDNDDEEPDPQAGADPTKRDPVPQEESVDTEQHPDIA